MKNKKIFILLLVTSPLWVPISLLVIFFLLLGAFLSLLIPFFAGVLTFVALVVGTACLPGGLIAIFKTGLSYGICELGFGIANLGFSILFLMLTVFIIKVYFNITTKYTSKEIFNYVRRVL